MSFHDEFVYPDQSARRRHARAALAILVATLAGLHLMRFFDAATPLASAPWYWWVGEGMLLAVLFAILLWRKSRPKLVVTGRGIGGEWIEQRLGRMLKWHRIQRVRVEPGAIVVDYEPFDAGDEKPEMQVAHLRLPGTADLSEDRLAEVISDYMPVESTREAA